MQQILHYSCAANSWTSAYIFIITYDMQKLRKERKKVRSKPPWKSRYIWGHTKVNFYPIFRFTRGKKVVRNFVTKAMPHLSKNERRSFPSTCFTFIFPQKSWIFGQKMKISNRVHFVEFYWIKEGSSGGVK